MKHFSVHEPAERSPDPLADGERVAFVRDGFSWFALLAPALWLIWHRMWLDLAGFLALAGVLGGFAEAIAPGSSLAVWPLAALNLLIAFEAANLRRWTLARRGYREVAVVRGRTLEECELSFFTDWVRARAEPRPAGGS